MAKLSKEPSRLSKEKAKVEIGKITKSKKATEDPRVRKLQVKLHSPLRAHRVNFENSSLATPFSKHSTLQFTSTPFNVEDKSNRRLSARLRLSPISKNVGSTVQGNENSSQKTARKSSSAAVVKENPSKQDKKGSKVSKENVNPDIRSKEDKKSGGMPVKKNTESSCRRLRVQLNRVDTSVETLSSDSNSSNQTNTTTKRTVVNQGDSSSIPSSRFQNRQNTENAPPSSGKNHSLVRGLRSDWSGTTFGEKTATAAQSLNTTSKRTETNDVRHQVRQNKCSKLRVRLRRSTLNTNSTSELSSINANSKQRKSNYENSLVNYLKSEWSDTTLGESSTRNCTPNNQSQRKQATNKRRLTPLIEMSLEDTDNSTEQLTDTSKFAKRLKSKNNEEEYSSSAEFQSDDDETNNSSRSKRAPTWKDLLNKTKTSEQQPVLRRSGRLESISGKNLTQTAEKKVTKTRKKEVHKRDSAISQVYSSTEVPSIEMENQDSTKETEEHDVAIEASSFLPSKQIHNIEEQNQNLVQEVSVCEEGTTVSSPQHNNLQETNFGKNTSSSPIHNDESTKYETIDLRCPVKFFHSRSENPVSQMKAQQSFKRPRSGRRKKQESVYEFLSQSSSESNNPVDDVIKKMIKTGKAVVAKHKKGTGKNVLPRKKRAPVKAQKKKLTKMEDIVQKPTKPLAEKPTKPLAEKPPIQEKIHDDFNGLQFDDDFNFDNGENDTSEEDQVRDQRGFSNLARSAMIKQAGGIQKPLQRKPITDKKKLLAMAMQFVSQSTPIRMTPQSIREPQFSPTPGNKSPWRVTDDRLPNPFYLGRDSNNLPSFSSDYIPMTPSKNKSKSLSSFSSNDSNGENTAPPGANTVTNEANLQALTNTRKALTYRSPLKAINIVDIVNLPPLALHSYGKMSNDENVSKNNSKEINHNSINKTARNILGNVSIQNSKNKSNNNSQHSTNSSNQSSNHSNQFEETQYQSLRNSMNDIQNNNNATNLFGFEELIDDNESNSTNISVDKTILPNKNVLKQRLERLKQLRPNNPVTISNKTERIKPIFDNVRPQQKTLKQMLCSTMIDKNQHNHGGGNHSFDETENLSNLFKDLEPETTFDDSLPRRTYNRQFKRKRKVLSNYATIIDSDVSEDEEVENQPIKHYKAKPNKRKKVDAELKKFVNEFNEMCKEVSQYELVVE